MKSSLLDTTQKQDAGRRLETNSRDRLETLAPKDAYDSKSPVPSRVDVLGARVGLDSDFLRVYMRSRLQAHQL